MVCVLPYTVGVKNIRGAEIILDKKIGNYSPPPLNGIAYTYLLMDGIEGRGVGVTSWAAEGRGQVPSNMKAQEGVRFLSSSIYRTFLGLLDSLFYTSTRAGLLQSHSANT